MSIENIKKFSINFADEMRTKNTQNKKFIHIFLTLEIESFPLP